MRILISIAGLIALAAAAAGCAAESLTYPTLPTAKNFEEKVLSKEEQQQAIRDLAAEQEQQQAAAIEEIEKSKQK